MNEIHVCFSTDNHYAPYCGVAIQSMLMNADEDDFIFLYILHKDLTNENIDKLKSLGFSCKCQIETVQVCEKHFENLPMTSASYLTIETYFRLIISRIFPDIDRMIYLDCDILVKGSLWELYRMDIKNAPLAMVKDQETETSCFNSGVVLINCDCWRKEEIETALYEYAEKNIEILDFPDQQMINGVLSDRIYEIDKKWNNQVVFENFIDDYILEKIRGNSDLCILHYIGIAKPWHGMFQNVLVDEYMEYMKMTPWELPDKRALYAGLSAAKYYNALWKIRSFFKKNDISGNESFLILHETTMNREIEYAAEDTGAQNVDGHLIKSDQWNARTPDFLIIEYHNAAIIHHILQAQGYDLQTDKRILLISEVPQGIDNNLLAMEYIEYLRELEDGKIDHNTERSPNETSDIHVCFSTNDHYAPYCGVAIQSILMNKAPEDMLHISILYQTLSPDNRKKLNSIGSPFNIAIDLVQLTENEFMNMPLVKDAHFTVEMYFRLAIPRLFPDAEKILYLDSDVIVTGSLRELFDQHIGDHFIGAVDDIDNNGTAEINSGVILYNCEKWRNSDIESIMCEYLENNRASVRFPDQEAINYAFRDNIYKLERKWNRQIHMIRFADKEMNELQQAISNSVIIHFVGFSKPWQGVVNNFLTDEYFDYLKRLPWDLPDHRQRNSKLNPHLYYWYLRHLRGVFTEKKISSEDEILLLHETAVSDELTYAAIDLGMHQVKSFLIKGNDWVNENPDFIFIVYHNPVIINHIMKLHGYDTASDCSITLIPEVLDMIDQRILDQEYEEFLKESEQKTFIILSSAPWSKTGIRQRPHHIARALAAAGQEVFYLSSCNELESTAFLEEDAIAQFILQNPMTDEGVLIYSPFKPVFKEKVCCDPFNSVLRHVLDTASFPAVVIAYLPKHILAINEMHVQNFQVIYECVDDHHDTTYAYWGNEMDFELEQRLFDRADAITTTATSLFLERTVIEGRNQVYLSRNAVNFLDFYIEEMPPCPDDLKDIPKPRIFYMGALYGRFDTQLFHETALQNKDKSFVVIGAGDESVLPKLDNIYFLGSKAHQELKDYLNHMQVGVIPFKDNISLTVHCDSIKLHEHLACGLPTVATFMPDTMIEKPYVFNANTPESFTDAINAALAVQVDVDTLLHYLKENAWEERAALLIRIANNRTLPDEQVESRLERIKEELASKWHIHPNLETLYALACKPNDAGMYKKHIEQAWEKSKNPYIQKQYDRMVNQ